jgi:ATP-binding cassette subfamily F protein uup
MWLPGNGRVEEYVGGYEDWLRQTQAIGSLGHQAIRRPAGQRANRPTAQQVNKPSKKRSFKEEREYAELPDRIAALEQEQKDLQAAIHDSAFYRKPPAEIHAALARVSAIEQELLAALERWVALDSIGKT